MYVAGNEMEWLGDERGADTDHELNHIFLLIWLLNLFYLFDTLVYHLDWMFKRRFVNTPYRVLYAMQYITLYKWSI